jgi:hypothetical protein
MKAAKQFCKRRNEIAEHLVELAIKLTIAATHMADAAGTSKDPIFVKAKLAAEHLRDECDSLQAELSRHRIEHGC